MAVSSRGSRWQALAAILAAYSAFAGSAAAELPMRANETRGDSTANGGVRVHVMPQPANSTVMYRGGARIGYVTISNGAGEVLCDAYTGAFIVTNKQRTWLNVHAATSGRLGFARLLRPRKWEIYQLPGRRLVGVTTERSAIRWDVFRGTRRVGHVVGRDGPQAAAALLVACWL